MSQHLQHEIENLKKSILSLGARIETAVREATLAIEQRDGILAQKIIDYDDVIDQQEVEIEEECLKTLALHQPVAIDLRFIITVLKINNDLERIGDLAVNIAERAVFLAGRPKPDISFDFVGMASAAQIMLKNSLDALVNLSVPLAQEVCAGDNTIDAMNRKMYVKIQQAILAHPEQIESLIHMLSVSRHLERIADHATNIAEDVIYMIEGRIVRHRIEKNILLS
ncbi:MAG TPA: phosphate signaling complex protein PhoU [Anaerohalosphaeraceae bacterium]|nr:phosphate signaling complex protein PhoU [Anaerohalosphaeraceae bacterium]HOL32316.1 phosphate signaling complex protein PhoU [Anaerohalosphaeraceae bacterium]HOM76871.1 phosphate signaling complex protein PhoU [Anaerohalosphaeraceae bacterium]HPC65250.1 phosphate signaling complex protein PhoU [Anaerohalosphaeraceae bacterium]HPO70596.1 phosphate signaling complex protein PhoU [Anaerohalosphaeraceae bacterium]